MSKRGQLIEEAFTMIAPAVAGLALDIERRKTSSAKLIGTAERLEKGAAILRRAANEGNQNA